MNKEHVELIKAYREFLVDAMSGKSDTTPEMVKTMTEAVKLALDYRWVEFDGTQECHAKLCPKTAAWYGTQDVFDRTDLTKEEISNAYRQALAEYNQRWE